MAKLFLCTIVLSCFVWGETNYAKVFGADYQRAIQYCQTEQSTVLAVTQQYQVPSDLVMSIVFPELIRYSTFKNFFESTALEYTYTKAGSKVADFSIGRFQMKPSFAEKLEVALKANPALKTKYSKIVAYTSKNLETQRITRLERLNSLAWQLTYLCGFYELMQTNIKTTLSTKEKIKYLATAYNCGFDKEEKVIQQWMHRKTFPYGAKYPEAQQYNYAAIALDFYINHSPDLFK